MNFTAFLRGSVLTSKSCWESGGRTSLCFFGVVVVVVVFAQDESSHLPTLNSVLYHFRPRNIFW